MVMIMDLEDKFGIMVEDDQIMKMKTVGDVVDYIEKHPVILPASPSPALARRRAFPPRSALRTAGTGMGARRFFCEVSHANLHGSLGIYLS